MEKFAFGIDFGTTNSLVSVWGSGIRKFTKKGKEAPLAFWDTGDGAPRPHPSVVWYPPNGGPTVGSLARKNMESQENAMGHTFVRSVKRMLGDAEDVALSGGRRIKTWEVAAEIFGHLGKHAGAQLKTLKVDAAMDRAVVTVPVDFNGSQRKQIRNAMERAGIQLTTFLHEPLGALISHFYDAETKLRGLAGKRALVFDWGGGTLDVSIVEVSQNGAHLFEIAHDGIADRAGDDFDKRIMTCLKDRFIRRSADARLNDVSPRGNAADRFWLRAEAAKIELSTERQVAVRVPTFIEMFGTVFDLEEEISRSDFEKLIEPEILAAEACVHRCLELVRLKPGLIDHVLMVGGTSNIPAVKSMLEHNFGAKVNVAHEPDAAIARGAAIVAAEGWQPMNVNPIGVRLSDETVVTVLDKDVPLDPSQSKDLSFFCIDPREGMAHIIFCERPIRGDQQWRSMDECLSVPVRAELDRLEHLERVIANFSITKDATLWCRAIGSATGRKVEKEIHNLCFGLHVG